MERIERRKGYEILGPTRFYDSASKVISIIRPVCSNYSPSMPLIRIKVQYAFFYILLHDPDNLDSLLEELKEELDAIKTGNYIRQNFEEWLDNPYDFDDDDYDPFDDETIIDADDVSDDSPETNDWAETDDEFHDCFNNRYYDYDIIKTYKLIQKSSFLDRAAKRLDTKLPESINRIQTSDGIIYTINLNKEYDKKHMDEIITLLKKKIPSMKSYMIIGGTLLITTTGEEYKSYNPKLHPYNVKEAIGSLSSKAIVIMAGDNKISHASNQDSETDTQQDKNQSIESMIHNIQNLETELFNTTRISDGLNAQLNILNSLDGIDTLKEQEALMADASKALTKLSKLKDSRQSTDLMIDELDTMMSVKHDADIGVTNLGRIPL